MPTSTVSKLEVEPFLVSIEQTAQYIGRCTATVYELLGSKQLEGVKSDGRTLVVMESIKHYVEHLRRERPVEITPRPRRKPQHLRQAEPPVPEPGRKPPRPPPRRSRQRQPAPEPRQREREPA